MRNMTCARQWDKYLVPSKNIKREELAYRWFIFVRSEGLLRELFLSKNACSKDRGVGTLSYLH